MSGNYIIVKGLTLLQPTHTHTHTSWMGLHSLRLSPRQPQWPWLVQRQYRALVCRALWLVLHSGGRLGPGRPAPSGLQSSAWSGTGTAAAPCCASPDACRTLSPYLRGSTKWTDCFWKLQHWAIDLKTLNNCLFFMLWLSPGFLPCLCGLI